MFVTRVHYLEHFPWLNVTCIAKRTAEMATALCNARVPCTKCSKTLNWKKKKLKSKLLGWQSSRIQYMWLIYIISFTNLYILGGLFYGSNPSKERENLFPLNYRLLGSNPSNDSAIFSFVEALVWQNIRVFESMVVIVF